ncbi:hypothetical protein WICPIJ_008286 [Wickerhamomyces pijperi]|uniref:Uncharacterized protein n=1 Tax=Wickerhamomyces pijperi TaxID=599730 RepID=A0A9P8PZK3_WICPI|nr:hypothetical protein WICPIJ_008286 [Wickerhamomyces pijperi]
MAQISDSFPDLLYFNSSGDTYSAVPTKEDLDSFEGDGMLPSVAAPLASCCVELGHSESLAPMPDSSMILAAPKSVIINLMSPFTRMFSGFRSLCITPLRCMNSTASIN